MKLTRQQWLRLALMGAALIAMILLISGISQVQLEPGLPFSSIWAFLIGDFTGIPRGPMGAAVSPFGSLFTDVMRAIFFIALLAFPIGVILVIIDPALRKRVLGAIVRVAIIAVLLSLFLQNQAKELTIEEEPPAGLAGPELEYGSPPPLTDEEFDPQTISPWVVWGASLGIGLLLAVMIIVIIDQIRKSRPEEETPLAEIVRRARQALNDIQSGGDLRNTILRCYAEMSRVVREERGVRREKGVTAREFTDYLVQANLPERDVIRLTRLFEKARYSGATPTASDEMEAVASLQSIIDACMAAE